MVHITTTRPHELRWQALANRNNDPRLFQIASLGSLLAIGLFLLGFDQPPACIAAVLASALATQYVGGRLTGLPTFDPLSPLITALSLCLLLRAQGPGWMALAAVLAIGSKFVVRVDGRHIFNPANFAIAGLMLANQPVWISPAQWGSKTFLAFLFVCLAGVVLSKAKRADIAFAFLATFIALLFLRAAYLDDPWAIPMKQMQSGALLLFAFFMISDPKTTPDQRGPRIVYAAAVAALAFYLIFNRYMPTGLMVALFVASPFVPFINRAFPVTKADQFRWSNPTVGKSSTP